MPEIIDIVNSEGIDLVNDIRANLGRTGTNATLRTSQSLRVEVKTEGTKVKMQMFGRPFFNTVNTGRKPTPGKKPSREMIENLSIWADARGIELSAVWAIANKIQASGTKLWQQGGREDIVPPAVDQFMSNVSTAILDNAATEFQIKIREMEW
jgi:hypothetical protein